MSFKFVQKVIDALRPHLSKDVLWEHYKKYKELEDNVGSYFSDESTVDFDYLMETYGISYEKDGGDGQ